jgi:PHD/YefM family antitoxin component YafN of YafNO toxin-antitoxin module
MEHTPVKTITSTEFMHNVSAAKRAAVGGSTVIITDRGQPSLALMSIGEYRRMSSHQGKNILELLSMPEAADLEIPRIGIGAQGFEP